MSNPENLARVRLAVEHYKNARRSRDAAIVAALEADCTQIEVAEAAGLTASAIRKIRKQATK